MPDLKMMQAGLLLRHKTIFNSSWFDFENFIVNFEIHSLKVELASIGPIIIEAVVKRVPPLRAH